MAEDALATILRERGHRMTEARSAVWAVLDSARGHLTADSIAEAVRTSHPGVNRSSVYRSLALFADLGIARQSSLAAEDAARWELAHPDDQFHLVCGRCGKVEHHSGDLVDQVRRHLGSEHGFRADRLELSVTGLCAECAVHGG